MAELADALDLKSNGYLIPVPVRVRPPARRMSGVAPIYRGVWSSPDLSGRFVKPDKILKLPYDKWTRGGAVW